ncbi:MAG: hypothetical protein KDE19_13700 [Caldilineaceae bacterium]|nr:hypothetical protein [Caldilineaceae bacterium]
MTEETQPTRTLHDRLFKEFLYRFLPDFLWIFFPAEAERLNFSTLRFLDKELIINFSGQELRITDIVAEVATWEGDTETIILHVEIEGRDKASLPQRMSEYYTLLRIIRQRPVLPLALVLLPGTDGLAWQRYEERIFGHTVLNFYYGQVGLRDLSGPQYLLENSPVAAALTVLMQAEGQSPALIKLEALEKVAGSALSDGDKLFLFEFMNTYAPTGKMFDAREEIMQNLLDIEATWGERLRAEGKVEGERQMLLHLLGLMFGELPPALVTRINAISDEATLTQLAQQIVTIERLDQLVLPEIEEEISSTKVIGE